MTRAIVIALCLIGLARADGPVWNLDTPGKRPVEMPVKPTPPPPKEKPVPAPLDVPDVPTSGLQSNKDVPTGKGVAPIGDAKAGLQSSKTDDVPVKVEPLAKRANPPAVPFPSVGSAAPAGGSVPSKYPPFHFHCSTGADCVHCPKAHSYAYWMKQYFVAPLEIHVYPNLDAAAAAGVPIVPSYEIGDNFFAWEEDPKKHDKHGNGCVCPKCLNDCIRRGGKPWPPPQAPMPRKWERRVANRGGR